MNPHPSRRSINSTFGVKLVLIAWLGMLGVDFFVHAGLLAEIYMTDSPFLLPPMEAFRRIPIGYMSFLIAAGFLVWIAFQLNVEDVKRGITLGFGVGFVMWVSLGFGLYSITTARPSVLLSWMISQSVEMAFAGGLIGLALQRQTLRPAFLMSLFTFIALVLLTIVLQSVGIVDSLNLGDL